MITNDMLAAGFWQWYHWLAIIGLIAVLIFYVIYRRNQM